MVSLVRLQGELLERLDSLLTQLLDLSGEHGLGVDGGVDTVGLDGDDDATLVLEEHVGVEGDDTGLVGLGDIGEDAVDHADEHAVLLGVSGVLDDGDDVGSLLGHGDELSAGSVGELDGVDDALWADDVGDVRDRGTGRGTEVQDLLARRDEQLVETTHDTGGQLGSEGVPDTVLDLGGWDTVLLGGLLDGDALLAVDGLTWGHVLGDEQILLASGNEDTGVLVRLDDNLGTTAGTTTGTTTGTATGTATRTAAAATGTTTTAETTTATTGATTATAETTAGTATRAATAAEAATAASGTTSATWSEGHLLKLCCKVEVKS